MLDRTLPASLVSELESLGIRAIHASEEEFAAADARTLLESAIEDECLLVTRNYSDFTVLSAAFRHAGRDFPGILFVGATAGEVDPARTAADISRWVEAAGLETAQNACCWLN